MYLHDLVTPLRKERKVPHPRDYNLARHGKENVEDKPSDVIQDHKINEQDTKKETLKLDSDVQLDVILGDLDHKRDVYLHSQITPLPLTSHYEERRVRRSKRLHGRTTPTESIRLWGEACPNCASRREVKWRPAVLSGLPRHQ